MSNAAAAQHSTILPSRQRQIFRVRRRTPLCGLSITLVETRQRERVGDRPKRFTVNISANLPASSPPHWDTLAPAIRPAFRSAPCLPWLAVERLPAGRLSLALSTPRASNP